MKLINLKTIVVSLDRNLKITSGILGKHVIFSVSGRFTGHSSFDFLYRGPDRDKAISIFEECVDKRYFVTRKAA